MRPKIKEFAPVAVDANGIAEAQTVLSATTLVLDGVLIVNDIFIADIARRVSIESTGDDSLITFTILGTSPDGRVQSEVVTGIAIGTATSTKYFKTIISITASAAAAANVIVGTVDEFASSIIPLNHYASDGATVSLENIVGTLDVSVEITFSDVQGDDHIFFAAPAGLTNETADGYADINKHATGVRLIGNSYSSGASLTMIVNQNRC
jgi:hypothetical protein